MQHAPISRARYVQENRTMRFQEAYEGWSQGSLTQAEAALLLGQCERSFRRHMERFEADGLQGLLDKRLSQISKRRASGGEVDKVVQLYKSGFTGWSVAHFHSKYKAEFAGVRSYSWLKTVLQGAGVVKTNKLRGKHRIKRERMPLVGMMIQHAANHYLEQVYRAAHNREFAVASTQQGSAYVPFISGNLPDILCEQHERKVDNDNCVRFKGMSLQIPADEFRYHYVRTTVRVHRYVDATLALFHGPRRLAAFSATGAPNTESEALKLAA
jgi:hypothetical protein